MRVTCRLPNLVSFDMLSCFYIRPLSMLPRRFYGRRAAQFATMAYTSNSHCERYESTSPCYCDASQYGLSFICSNDFSFWF